MAMKAALKPLQVPCALMANLGSSGWIGLTTRRRMLVERFLVLNACTICSYATSRPPMKTEHDSSQQWLTPIAPQKSRIVFVRAQSVAPTCTPVSSSDSSNGTGPVMPRRRLSSP